MADSVLGGAITFFDKIGVYDVVLPFLLVFTLVFALLERTKILGTEEITIDGKAQKYSKKNLNSMAAFVIAFFVVASSHLVEAITTISANMVLLLLLITFLLLLVGSFYAEGHVGTEGLENKAIKGIFLGVISFGIVLIFLDGIKTAHGDSWLEVGYYVLLRYWDSSAFAALLLIAFLIGFVWFVGRSKTERSGGSSP